MVEPRVQELVRLAFQNLPFSEEMLRAQAVIAAALQREYARAADREDPFDDLMGRYGSLSAMAALAGYAEADVRKWKGEVRPVDLKSLKRMLRGESARCGLFAAFAVLAVLYGLQGAAERSFSIGIALVFAGLAVWMAVRLFRKGEERDECYELEAYRYLQRRTDQFKKRSIDAIFLCFGIGMSYAFLSIVMIWNEKAKLGEVGMMLVTQALTMAVPVFLCLWNRKAAVMADRRMRLPSWDGYRRHFARIIWISCAYLAFSVLVVRLCVGNALWQFGVNIALIALYFLAALAYTLFWRRKIVHQNLVFNRKKIAVVTAVVLAGSGISEMYKDTWFTQRYINATPIVPHAPSAITYDAETGIYTITAETENFRILQLTDIHLGGSATSAQKDERALDACYRLIRYAQPDLVVVTGDMCYPVGLFSLSFNNSAPVQQFAAFMRNTGIPWAFTYGNHDTERMAGTTRRGLDELYKSLSWETSGNLLYPYVQPEITGRNNQLIEIRNSDGTLNQALFLIDSNAYTSEGLNDYDYIHDDQVQWYTEQIQRLNEEEGKVVSSLAFFHIPLQQYRTAYALYAAGSDEVVCHFGENNERMFNKVCCSAHPSAFFDAAKALGSTKAMFCGHDHYNNMSLEYEGIRLTYGMSIDFLATPGTDKTSYQRGATLISLRANSEYEIEQIPIDSIA